MQKIEQAAQRILDVRENYRQQAVDWNEKIAKAHQALDKAVDNAYGYQGGNNDEARVAFLFGLLQQNSVEK